ncbi:hypothetical protein CI109_105347 [Kwoniella shandongensis]|uniref:Uncharacterized protein n=1 Tax=Kwoniella shandongensis TaxID=1734106 RepID=A0AAJ8MXA4_9TREE
MQNVIDAATSLVNTAATYTGLTSPTSQTHSHAEEHAHRSTLPTDVMEVGTVKKMDSAGLGVFEEETVRHEVLVKINKLAVEDARHGISYYHPLRYFTVTRPIGVEYIGEIEIEAGKSIHVRAHKASPSHPATFHSLDTRPSDEGGAVFKTGEPLGWFDY